MINNNFCVIIPARLHSTRLPKKVLMDINGIPMVIKVAQQAQKSNATNVIIATDSQEVIDISEKYNINYFLTMSTHRSGTERIVEVVKKHHINENIIINVQADEPLIDPQNINLLANHIFASQTPMATVASYIEHQDELHNPNIVKLVIDKFNNALYFSRAVIPAHLHDFENNVFEKNVYLKHTGIYAYKKSFLSEYDKLKISSIEKIESLEQLRVLYNNIKINVLILNNIPYSGIDTLEDLNNIKKYFKN